MARKRKNRTHLKGPNNTKATEQAPKSFVIKHGRVGSSLTQLVRDIRKVMEPNTASRLKERNRNKLKDFLTMAPALEVTHLLAFTLTPVAPSLRIIRLPAGPTLSFRVERYSLMKDILNASRHPRSIGMEYLSAPLLVLASFPPPGPGTPPHLPLVMKAFQSLFPPLSPQTITLSSARRVVLVSYDPDHGTINFRHYVIKVKPHGVSKRVRKVLEGSSGGGSNTRLLDLGGEKDVADFLLRKPGEVGPESGYESAASSAESIAGDDADAVSLVDDYVGRNNKKGQRRAVKLEEIGPRMELRLVKITEGVPGKEGNVIYHEFVKKTKKEVAAQKAEHVAKEKQRKQRREEQERNVKRKLESKEAGESGVQNVGEEDVEEDEMDVDESEDQAGSQSEDYGEWDEEEEISDGDEDDDQFSSQEESDAADEPPRRQPRKKSKGHDQVIEELH